jgi:hypothetical protein
MMKADFGHAIDDLFAVELKHNAQHAMRARMLWADIQEDNVAVPARACHAPFLGPEAERLLLGFFFGFGQPELSHFRRSRGMVFSQWVAFPGSRHQDAGEVRMP